ncbi:MAG TPA: hypothetical protein VGG60_11410 [Candidatus Binataceae bacterium]
MKLHLRLLLLSSLVAAVSILTERNAAAQLDPYEFEVYPYATLSRGMIEIESDNAVVANGHNQPDNGLGVAYPSQATWFSGEEFTYGLTDRIESAAYVTFSQPSGHGFWWAGDKFRLRGRLFDEGVLPVDLGWYTELEWHKTPQFDDADLELELKPIMEKDFGRFSIVLNPVFEKVLYGGGHHEGFEFGYRNGAYYRWLKYLSPGVEAYGGIGGIDNSDPLDEQNHYLFAVLWGQFPHGIEYSLGPGFGLTKGSDHVVMKFNIELERWLGAIFGPSSEKSWFF